MNYKFILPAFLLFAAAAHADPTVTTVSFAQLLIYGTDTFENSTGTVLSTARYVYWSGEIPQDIANDIASDSAFATSDPAAQAFIQANVSRAALTNDLDYLTAQLSAANPQLPDVLYTSASPTVYTEPFENVLPPGDFSAAFPAFAVSSLGQEASIGVTSYETGAFDSSGNIIDGVVQIDAYRLDLIEQPAVPEPTSPAIVFGLVTIVLRAKKRGRSS